MNSLPVRTVALLAALCGVPSFAQQPAAAPSMGERQALFVTALLSRVCVATAGLPRQVELAVEKMRLKPMRREEAGRFLGPAGGTAWPVQMQGGEFVVSSRPDRVCTIYARRVDADALLREVTAMLPSAANGFQVVKEDSLVASSASTITSYQIRRDGKPFATWVINTSTLPDAFFQGAVSVKMAQ